jgi:fatty-acid desaturase
MDRKNHWEHVYTTRASDQVSWFQADPAMSLALLEQVGLTAKA